MISTYPPTDQRQPTDQTPDEAAGTQTPAGPGRAGSTAPAGHDGSGKTTTGTPRSAAAPTAPHDPEPHDGQPDEPGAPKPDGGGPPTSATTPLPGPEAATPETKASERRTSRATGETDGPPPAQKTTRPPEERTGSKDEAGEDDCPTRPAPDGP